MLENGLESFTESIFLFLTGRAIKVKGLLVKKHVENLQTHGDFSFPGTAKSWHEFIDSDQNPANVDASILEIIGKTPNDIIEESRKWNLQVKIVKEEKGRVYLFLERSGAIPLGLSEGVRNVATVCQNLKKKFCDVRIDPLCEETNSITNLRVKYISKVIENLCSISLDRDRSPPEIFVTSKSSSLCAGYKILCSSVLSTKTGTKEEVIGPDEFISIRQTEMSLIAQHKYGVRVASDSKWQEFIRHLGESAAAYELLQNKPSSVVKINFDVAIGSSKGASFILYNCARLETIIRTYNDNVNKGIYPPLPDFDKVDFSVLTQEDEWNLIFNYIMGLPYLIDSCVELNNKGCEFRPHYICNYLSSMVRIFSQYYRRTRILVEAREHLLPTIYARMHMLIVLSDILKTCLNILNIKSVSQM